MVKSEIEKLLEIMARLRDPAGGCPWDLEQDFASIAPYTVEEAYEVADAIAREDFGELQDELGDLLFQVVFHAQMAAEAGLFSFADVVQSVNEKMVRRHPHVFGDEASRGDAQRQLERWEDIKAAERATKASEEGALDGVAKALPAIQRAQKLGKRAARVGFDWPDASGVRAKLDEELAELAAAGTPAEREEELGDVLFTLAQLARHLGVDAEQAARVANDKFERRFRAMERQSAESLSALGSDALEALWTAVK